MGSLSVSFLSYCQEFNQFCPKSLKAWVFPSYFVLYLQEYLLLFWMHFPESFSQFAKNLMTNFDLVLNVEGIEKQPVSSHEGHKRKEATSIPKACCVVECKQFLSAGLKCSCCWKAILSEVIISVIVKLQKTPQKDCTETLMLQLMQTRVEKYWNKNKKVTWTFRLHSRTLSFFPLPVQVPIQDFLGGAQRSFDPRGPELKICSE